MVSIFFPPIKHGILYAPTEEIRAYRMQFRWSFFACFLSLIFWLLYHLTLHLWNGIFYKYGEVSEWFKEPVLKTGDGATHRGFESHSLRQTSFMPGASYACFRWTEKGRRKRFVCRADSGQWYPPKNGEVDGWVDPRRRMMLNVTSFSNMIHTKADVTNASNKMRIKRRKLFLPTIRGSQSPPKRYLGRELRISSICNLFPGILSTDIP